MSGGRSDRTTSELAAELREATGSQWAYLWRLLQEREDAGPELAQVLRSLPADQRARAIGMLGTTAAASSPEVVSALVEALGDERVRTRQAAVQRLGALRAREAVDALAAVVADAPPEVRVDAVRALAAIGDAGAVAPIVAALRDEDEGVRAAAAEALYDLREPEAGQALREALGDSSQLVRQWAERALGRLGDPAAAGESRAPAGGGNREPSLIGSWYSDPMIHAQTYVYTFREDATGEVEDINMGVTNEQTPFTYRRRDGVLEFRFGDRPQPVETRFRLRRGTFRDPYRGDLECAVLVFDREPYFTEFGAVDDATYYNLNA